MASIPHGDSMLAMGFADSKSSIDGPPDFNDPELLKAFDAFPVGAGEVDLDQNSYLAPYKHFRDQPFLGVEAPPFPGFTPSAPLKLLDGAIGRAIPGSKIVRTQRIFLDSDTKGGINNIPFIVCQAAATKVTSVFWIQKVEVGSEFKFVLQYAQLVMLEFHKRVDGKPGLIRWPHITINTMIRSDEAG